MFFILQNGIKIDQIDLPFFKIEKLYIKLDKKLILSIKEMQIQKQSSQKSLAEGSKNDLEKTLSRLPWLDMLFKVIQINSIKFNDNEIKITFKDDIFYIDTKFLTLDTKLKAEKSKLKLIISSLIYKDFNLVLNGISSIDLKQKTMSFDGDFSTYNINGKLSLDYKNNILNYTLSTDELSTLKPFMNNLVKKVKLEKLAKEWISDNVLAKSYKIESLSGKINTKTWDYFPLEMKAKASIKEANIHFNEKILPVFAEAIDISLVDNKLIFKLINADFQGIKVKSEELYIYNLLTKKTGIIINLQTKTLLEKRVHSILKAYNINIPLSQISGQTEANLTMDIRFLPYDFDIKGNFLVTDSNYTLSGGSFYTKESNISLDNSLVIFNPANLIYKKVFDISSNGVLDTKSGEFDGSLNIKSFNIKASNNEILNVKDLNLSADFNITKNEFLLNLKEIPVNLVFKKDSYQIKIPNLGYFYKFSPLMQNLGIKNANFNLRTKSFDEYFINLNISEMNNSIYDENGSLKEANLSILYKPNELIVHSKDKRIKIKEQNNELKINLKDLNLFIKDSNSSNKSEQNITLNAIRSNIILGDINKTIKFDSYEARKEKDKTIIRANYEKGLLNLRLSDDSLSLSAFEFSDKFINNIYNKNIFNEGKFSLTIEGKDTKNYSGNFKFSDTYIKDLSYYHQLLELINSIPSLLFFKSPNFNEDGFEIKNANVLFSRIKDKITIHSLELKGSSADIAGYGQIDLNTSNINLELELKTLKDVSKIIDKIPLLNFIVLGENKSISTAISIKGNLDKPKFQTHLIEDTALSPFNIIKRTFQLPFKILD